MTDEEEMEFFIMQQAKTKGEYAIAYAILKSADALGLIAHKLERLGNNNGDTNMGALEHLGKTILEANESLGSSIGSAMKEVADAIEGNKSLSVTIDVDDEVHVKMLKSDG